MKIAACGRRWGKSEGLANDLATYAIAYPGTKQIYFAPSLDQTEIVYGLLTEIADCDVLRGEVRYKQSPLPEVQFGDSMVLLRTVGEAVRGKRLRGRGAHRVVIDEAAYIRESVINSVIWPMLIDYEGAQMIMISSPFGRNHLHRSYLLGRPEEPGHDPDYRSWNLSSYENPYLAHGLIDKLRRRMTDMQYRSEILAEFVEETAGVFAWRDIEACIDPELEDAGQEPDGRYLMGVDLGKYRDYSCIVIIERSKLPVRVVHFERFHQISWPEQKARIRAASRAFDNAPMVIDSTGPGDPVADDLARGARCSVHRFHFTSETKRRLVENLAQFISLRRVRYPYIERLIEELRYYEYELVEPGRVRFAAAEGYHDDTVVALGLSVWRAQSLLAGAWLRDAERASRPSTRKPRPKAGMPELTPPWEHPGLPDDLKRAAR